jgi:hypothetical protein
MSILNACVCVCVCVIRVCAVLCVCLCGTVDGTEISTWDVKDIVDLIVGPQVHPHSAPPFLTPSPFPDVKDIVGPRNRFAGALTHTRRGTHCRDHSYGLKSQRFPKTNSLPLPLTSRQPSLCEEEGEEEEEGMAGGGGGA